MQPMKFQFDTTFDDDFLEAQKIAEEAVVEEEAPPPPTFSEEEMAACRDAAFTEGHAAGQAETEMGISRIASDALQVIGSEIGKLAALQTASAEETHRDALSLAVAIVRKTVPAIALETAAAAIESFVRESLVLIMEEPRIVVRISDSLLEQIKEDLEQIAVRSGYPGQMIVISDPELSTQDCRIEWADGGAERDSGRIWREIDESIERFLESQAPTSLELPKNTDEVEIIETLTPERVSPEYVS